MANATCCSATCWRASDGIQWAVQSNLFGAPRGSPGAISEPELSPMLSGFAAYCDPSSLGELESESIAYRHRSRFMSTRTAKFVSAVFAGVLASIPLTTPSQGETPAPDTVFPLPRATRPRATIGITALSTVPNAIAGTSVRKATGFRKEPHKISCPRQSHHRRKQKRLCSAPLPTHMLNCRRKRTATTRQIPI